MCRRLLPALVAAAAWAQSWRPGPQVVTYSSQVDDTDQPYGLYVPKSYDPSRKYPLVVSLHGEFSNHRLNLRRVFGKGNLPGETDAEATRYFPPLPDVDFIVVSPLARGTMGYQGVAERDVYDVIDDVKKRFAIDEERVSLTGLSMGGGGALWLGLTRPDLWAAIAAVCPSPPPETEDLAANAGNIPVQLFQGALDPLVRAESTRKWHKLLLDAGAKADYTEFSLVRHNAWDSAYRNAAVFRWFEKQRRARFPEHVHFATRRYAYNRAWWVRIDSLVPGKLTTIDARFTARNQVEVRTEGVDAFTLTLTGHPMVTPGQPLIAAIDGVVLRAKAQEAVTFERAGKGWRAARPGVRDRAKVPGAEGPIADAAGTRHIYVYGTADAPGDEELVRRRDEACKAAEWSTPKHPLLLTFHCMSDAEVTGADLTSNLVLFGTRQTNALIARFAPQLPIELNAGAADYGLFFVAPAGGRYVAVNSGLPFWTGAEDAHRDGAGYLPATWRLLLSFGDYVLFRGSLSHMIAEGRFDQSWKLPAPEAAKMTATGAVRIHP